jgi:L-amino acid N-acyltransferase
MELRKAVEADLPAITFIYNDAVLNTNATFDTEPKSIENRSQWLLERTTDFPVLVAVENEEVIGYCSLSRWSDKKAYDITAELSLYIHPEQRGKGTGKKLLHALLDEAYKTNLHSIISRITEGNDHSIYLHKAEGFDTVGVLKQSGRKFGKLLDVTIMQKMLK